MCKNKNKEKYVNPFLAWFLFFAAVAGAVIYIVIGINSLVSSIL